ncbi:unnamed protein product [Closterium sp. Naga37s-1]|nr:unnamed protein product [Closterium sp. Naga37s-1]
MPPSLSSRANPHRSLARSAFEAPRIAFLVRSPALVHPTRPPANAHSSPNRPSACAPDVARVESRSPHRGDFHSRLQRSFPPSSTVSFLPLTSNPLATTVVGSRATRSSAKHQTGWTYSELASAPSATLSIRESSACGLPAGARRAAWWRVSPTTTTVSCKIAFTAERRSKAVRPERRRLPALSAHGSAATVAESEPGDGGSAGKGKESSGAKSEAGESGLVSGDEGVGAPLTAEDAARIPGVESTPGIPALAAAGLAAGGEGGGLAWGEWGYAVAGEAARAVGGAGRVVAAALPPESAVLLTACVVGLLTGASVSLFNEAVKCLRAADGMNLSSLKESVSVAARLPSTPLPICPLPICPPPICPPPIYSPSHLPPSHLPPSHLPASHLLPFPSAPFPSAPLPSAPLPSAPFLSARLLSVHAIRDTVWQGVPPEEGSTWLRSQSVAATWHLHIFVPLAGGVVNLVAVLRPVLKAVAAAVTLGTGNSLGPEGPSVEIGASVGKGAGKVLQGGRERTIALVAAGSAAGISAGESCDGLFNSRPGESAGCAGEADACDGEADACAGNGLSDEG